MKFAVANEHKDFFLKNQAIEFEGLLTPVQITQLKESIASSLSKRLRIVTGKIEKVTPEKLFISGRDLWRDSDEIKKVTTNIHLAEIASELIQKKPLRLGYDQYLPVPIKSSLPHKLDGVFDTLLTKAPNLEEISCLQGVLCGLIICLEDFPQEEQTEVETTENLPSNLPSYFPL